MSFRKMSIWGICMLAYIMLALHSFIPHHHVDDLHLIDHHGHAHHVHHHESSDHDHHSCSRTQESSSESSDCLLHIHHSIGDCNLIAAKETQTFQKKKVINDEPVVGNIYVFTVYSFNNDYGVVPDSHLLVRSTDPSDSRGPPVLSFV